MKKDTQNAHEGRQRIEGSWRSAQKRKQFRRSAYEGFLVKIKPTNKGFSSRVENSKKSLTSAENSTAFHYFNQANFTLWLHLYL